MQIKMERAKTAPRERSMVPNTQYETIESDDGGEHGGGNGGQDEAQDVDMT